MTDLLKELRRRVERVRAEYGATNRFSIEQDELLALCDALERAISGLQQIDLQPDEIGPAADEASPDHQACWHAAHDALAEIKKLLEGTRG